MMERRFIVSATGFWILWLLVLPLIPSAVQAEVDPIEVVVTEFQGPDPGGVPVTESIASWLGAIADEKNDFSVMENEISIELGDSFAETFAGFMDQGVDLVIFGQYDIPGTYVKIVISAACLSGTYSGQILNFHLDSEGTFSLTELDPDSPPPDRIRFIADVLTAFIHLSWGNSEQVLADLEDTSELEEFVPIRIAALAWSFRSLAELEGGNISSAFEHAERAISMDPEGSLHYIYRGAAYELQGEFRSALQDYSRVYQLDPSNAENLYNMSRMHRQLEEYESAIERINEAIAISPNEPVYLNTKGFIYIHMGDYDSALENITEALDIAPDYPTGWANLACVQRELGEIEDAIGSFTIAQEYQSDPFLEASYLKDRGYCHSLLEDYESAILDYQESNALSGGTASTHAYLGWLLMQTGDYVKGRISLDTALRMDPDNPEYLCWRGKCNYQTGEFQSAIDDYTDALTLNPDGFNEYSYLGRAYGDMGEYETAANWFTQGIERSEIQEEKAWLYSHRGVVLTNLYELEEAAEDFTKAIELFPEESFFYFLLGECFWVLDRESDAIPCYTIALEKGLDDEYIPWCYYERGRSYLVLEDYQAAVEDLTRSLENSDERIECYYFRGKAHYLSGDFERARQDFEHYLQVGNARELLNYANAFLREISE